MFSGFDDGGWWLAVLGCQGGQRSPGLAKKLAKKQPKSGSNCCHGGERDRGERKLSFWVDLCLI